ncbi:hypothetical protein EZ428_05825 [Pedobacter frigiditerrae]|uniref:Tetratricopeptide repeat-containing protein n=1 Tax=Pedobacter frigiditerrae TaxID=2530452 RepID=A0A4R0N4I6_9SPHI|nr:hypothetical protein [Pedobacter frigiditerrae]TCC94293.1 hypothetical protein EZ428_05825 [Pedobacter frigiditerrae]
MKSLNWKKSLIFCVSFFAVFFGEVAVNIACGPEQDPYDYYVSYFHNNVQGNEYSPFAFNEMVYLYNENEVESEAEINSTEWAKYLNVKKEDVFKVMYAADSATSVKLSSFQSITSLPDSLKQNSFLQSLTQKEGAKKYYLFAKSVEPLVTKDFDIWNPVAKDSLLMLKKADEANELALYEKDNFLKLRYAYQAERLYHYNGNYEKSKAVYEKLIEKNESISAVKGWALAIYAGAVRYAGKPDEAAYLFSKVFAGNPERRVQAYKNYYYTSSPLENALKFTKNNAEKASVWAINAFGNPTPDLESLHKIYEYAPSSLLNGALLVREINKLEQNLIKESTLSTNPADFYFNRYNDENKNVDSLQNASLKHLQSIKDFALKLAADKKYPQPELGTISAAYLSWMENNPDESLTYLASLTNPDKLPERLTNQVRIIQLLISATKINKGSEFKEIELVPVLKWLDEKRFAENIEKPTANENYYDYDWANGENRFTLTTRNFYQQILAPAYAKMKDTAKAAMAMLKGDLKFKSSKQAAFLNNMSASTIYFWQNSLSPKTMLAIADLKVNYKSDGLDGMLSEGLNKLSSDDFYELLGTTYLRTHEYDKALTAFNKISVKYKYFAPSNWYSEKVDQKTYANPFIERIRDYPKRYGTKSPGITKKTFAQEMLRLQKLTVSDKANAALYYYKMANAIYQTGYYGNSWFLISYDWSSFSNFEKPTNSYDADYKLALTAENWYLKARTLTKDVNLKAKCTFMLAKCQQKKIINNSYGNINWYDDDYKESNRKFLALNYNNPYFKEMKLKYAATPYYKIAVGECSYFREFLRPTKYVKPKQPRVIVIDKGR